MNTLALFSGAVTLLGAIMVITRQVAVHAVLYLVVTLLGLATVFALLGAPFAAALEVIIYAGAIMVLFVFVIMMLNLGQSDRERERVAPPPHLAGPCSSFHSSLCRTDLFCQLLPTTRRAACLSFRAGCGP